LLAASLSFESEMVLNFKGINKYEDNSSGNI